MAASLVGTAGSLVECLDKKLLIILRDGRHLVGLMRTFDQYSNVVLEDACERHVVGDAFGDIPLGIFIVRGDNIVLMGELDDTLEAHACPLRKVAPAEILEMEMAAAAAAAASASKKKSEWDME